jgi:hypothetical protein
LWLAPSTTAGERLVAPRLLFAAAGAAEEAATRRRAAYADARVVVFDERGEDGATEVLVAHL